VSVPVTQSGSSENGQANGGLVGARLVEVDDLAVHYAVRKGASVRAVDGVSFSISAGRTLGLVGESGCGKSTLGRAVLRLAPILRGRIRFDGVDITDLPERNLRPFRPRMQVIFQDPFSSLNPLKRVERIIGEPLLVHGIGDRRELRAHVAAALERVGLPPDVAERYPHEFSGGQRQRIAIARALALRPRFVVADEPVSALDVSIQAQVINLLQRLQREEGLAYLFISHDLGVIRHVADEVAVMYLGRIVEFVSQDELFARPLHPYTEALMSAVPAPDPDSSRARRIVLSGDLPNPSNPPPGCSFHTRCRYATEVCTTIEPALVDQGGGHLLACHHPLGSPAPSRSAEG
jgi:oligopeptide/dipeptide ABC transporter ATP-binding protein